MSGVSYIILIRYKEGEGDKEVKGGGICMYRRYIKISWTVTASFNQSNQKVLHGAIGGYQAEQ